MTISGDFLNYWEILGLFLTVALYSGLMLHSKYVFCYLGRLAIKISEGGVIPYERMDHAQLIQGLSDQTKVADANFLVSVVELTLFLSISVCWFWLSETRKQSQREIGLLV